MAPDYMKNNTYSSSVDIWALGIMIDEIVHQRIFYYDREQRNLVEQI